MQQRTVLIVEDEPLIRMALADCLREEGYDVIEAGTVLEAVAILGIHRIEAVITDIDMPGSLNGLDLARMVTSTQPGIPVIIASGGRVLKAQDLPKGARFVSKPYGLDAMISMLSQMTIPSTCVGLKLVG